MEVPEMSETVRIVNCRRKVSLLEAIAKCYTHHNVVEAMHQVYVPEEPIYEVPVKDPNTGGRTGLDSPIPIEC
jgi:hypothetical protein